ncbi:UNVERIFIED_CONTAM: Retrovirus-related Pol polyprotein from transposon TNT 1-94 [Sesamum latifolium]|uniref:Retrovirus-related Pol polyprotein from transposon TNT 1-94 n=1 Tax=Sesamum latifolium TaxID=2727402 RepID=A0AAW2SRY1_9LAMI
MDSMSSNKVWTLVDIPKGVKPVGCKWVYKRKLGADGEVTTFKARLVEKAAWYDYEIWQMDMKTAFLNGFVEERDLYGSAGGFYICWKRAEGLTYPKVNGSSVAFLVLYVDDILLIENDLKMLGDTKVWWSTQFSKKDLGEASYILGIKIIRDRSKRMLGITQTSYVEKVLKRFKMENSKRGFLPVRHGVKLSKKQSPKLMRSLEKCLTYPMLQP